MKRPSIETLMFNSSERLESVLRQMNGIGSRFAFAVDDERRLVGIVTDGDVRRAFLNGADLASPADIVINHRPISYPDGHAPRQYREFLVRDKVFVAPLVDPDRRLVDFVSLETTVGSPNEVWMDGGETVLVTGGAGYIGSILCRLLLDAGYCVRVLDNLAFGLAPIEALLERPGFELLREDIRHIEVLDRAIFGVDRIIHLAAIVGDPACQLDSAKAITSNLFATQAMAEIARRYRVKQFIFASSCSVYGNSGESWADETSPVEPASLYSETRLDAESYLLKLNNSEFCTTIARLATVFGLSPRMRFDLVVNVLAAHAVSNREITIFGPEQFRPFIHVTDVAAALMQMIQAPLERVAGQIFNVGSDKENYTMEALGRLVTETVDGTRISIQPGHADPRSYRISCAKIADRLGFACRTSVSEGIREVSNALEGGRISDHSEFRFSNLKTLERQAFQIMDTR